MEAEVVKPIQPPDEMLNAEGLVVRQAQALVIASDDDYKQGRAFLNQVILPGKAKVVEFFEPHVRRANEAHKALTKARQEHLDPWAQAEAATKAALAEYSAKREAENRRAQAEAERIARAQAEEQRRQEAEAERLRAQAEAEQRRQEAERLAAEAKAEAEARRKAMTEAAQANCPHGSTLAGKCATFEQCERRVQEQLAAEERERDAAAREEIERLEREAAAIEQAGKETAGAIMAERLDVTAPAVAVEKLKGAAGTWKCDREKWDPVAFAIWIAESPKDRAKYIGAPEWKILDAEAKSQRERFDVGGIVARKVQSVRGGA